MAVFTDKQLLAVAVVGGLGAWFIYNRAARVVNDTIETAGEVGEAVGFLGEYYLDQAVGYVSSALETDLFDKKYRHQLPLFNDEQYERWKAAVQAGQIENNLPDPTQE